MKEPVDLGLGWGVHCLRSQGQACPSVRGHPPSFAASLQRMSLCTTKGGNTLVVSLWKPEVSGNRVNRPPAEAWAHGCWCKDTSETHGRAVVPQGKQGGWQSCHCWSSRSDTCRMPPAQDIRDSCWLILAFISFTSNFPKMSSQSYYSVTKSSIPSLLLQSKWNDRVLDLAVNSIALLSCLLGCVFLGGWVFVFAFLWYRTLLCSSGLKLTGLLLSQPLKC